MTWKRTSPMDVYRQLLEAYGPQGWWPADTPFEVMVGAVLTQNTSWNNVEKAIDNLKRADMLSAEEIAEADTDALAELIRPSGFFRQKSLRLQEIARFFLSHGRTEGLKRWPTTSLRIRLLDVYGVGPETADSILLYALDKPVCVIDAYTLRIFHRLGLIPEKMDYDKAQNFCHQRLAQTLPLLQEFHALIVEHAKRHCTKKPACEHCPLQARCVYFHEQGKL
jgi:endonuclease-3 related protein